MFEPWSAWLFYCEELDDYPEALSDLFCLLSDAVVLELLYTVGAVAELFDEAVWLTSLGGISVVVVFNEEIAYEDVEFV